MVDRSLFIRCYPGCNSFPWVSPLTLSPNPLFWVLRRLTTIAARWKSDLPLFTKSWVQIKAGADQRLENVLLMKLSWFRRIFNLKKKRKFVLRCGWFKSYRILLQPTKMFLFSNLLTFSRRVFFLWNLFDLNWLIN